MDKIVVDSDQLASLEASSSESTLFSKEGFHEPFSLFHHMC